MSKYEKLSKFDIPINCTDEEAITFLELFIDIKVDAINRGLNFIAKDKGKKELGRLIEFFTTGYNKAKIAEEAKIELYYLKQKAKAKSTKTKPTTKTKKPIKKPTKKGSK